MLEIFAVLGLISLIFSMKLNSKILLIPAAMCMVAPVVPTFHLSVWQTKVEVALICICIISQVISVYLKNKRLKSEALLVKF